MLEMPKTVFFISVYFKTLDSHHFITTIQNYFMNTMTKMAGASALNSRETSQPLEAAQAKTHRSIL